MNSYREEQPKAHVQRRAWGWLIVSSVLLLVVTAVVAFDVRRYFTVSEVMLPNLVGLTHEQAAQTLRREGLDPVSFVEYVAGVGADVVTSMAPEPGTVVKTGRTVHLGVNTPPAAALVPDVIGLLQSEALTRAAELNLPVGMITFEPSDRAAGRVIAQEPSGGERLGENRILQLVVSSGRQVGTVAMPDLTGTNVDDAEVALRALGFRVIERLPAAVSFTGPGTVVSTVPSAEERVATSTPVILQYALSTANVVAVPEVMGMPQWRAQLALRAAQLQLGPVTYVQDPAQPEGVIGVQPTGFTLPGTPVLLTVNGEAPEPLFGEGAQGGLDLFNPGTFPGLGGSTPAGGTSQQEGGSALPSGGTVTPPPTTPGDGSRLVPFTFDPTNMGVRRLLEERYRLKVVVDDERGERIILDQVVEPGQTLTTSIPVYGPEAMLQTYIDDVFFQAWRP